ncbi:MAG: threonine-phosphate decarboxylase [Rhodobacteraceae bacterium]|nr:threonine-phosphate decarboxylase [Paracoccaceae bacterium]
MRDHGGNIDKAAARFGGKRSDWIDLSTGINRVPYPVGRLSAAAWTDLPTESARDTLIAAAANAYRSTAAILPVAGAQAAIQLIPRLTAPAHARVLGPTYNEHAGALVAAGWQVKEVSRPEDLAGADLAVIVNPNNPDGRRLTTDRLLALQDDIGTLVVDESFADPRPDCSIAPFAGRPGLLILRSFGKFYGLAGLRLGFVLGSEGPIARLAAMAGPWPVSGAAIELGRQALSDTEWQAETTARLTRETARMDEIAASAGWRTIGGTELFRLYDTGNALKSQERLAKAHIWSRVFPYSDSWLRLGMPGTPEEWSRLAAALATP